MVVKSLTYYPEYMLTYESGMTCTLLSWVLVLSGLTVKGGLLGRRSKHRTEARPQVLGAWSPSLDGDLDPLTGVEQVGLICARDIDEVYISRYPALS
jgi:hypothetical protein